MAPSKTSPDIVLGPGAAMILTVVGNVDPVRVADIARSILPEDSGPVIPRDHGTEPDGVAELETSRRMEVSMNKWAVVACDQFTSQPEYWAAVEQNVGDAPSTLRLILPEAKLNDPDVEKRIADINGAMKRYVDGGVFKTLPATLIYMERTQSDGKVRHGLIGMAMTLS